MNRTAQTGVVAAAALLLLAGCGGSDAGPTPTPSPSQEVTLAAPPVAESTDVQLSVTAPPNTDVDIYAYSSGWGAGAPNCTASGDPLRSVKVNTSPSEVSVSVPHPGRWWWVVTAADAGGLSSRCGAVSTLAKATPELALAGPRPMDGLDGYNSQLPVGQPFKFYVLTEVEPPAPLGAWPVSAEWIGPYASAPEAHAAPCDGSAPAALRVRGKAAPDKPATLTATPKRPGVYRIVAATAASEWNTETSSGCDASAPYLVVR